MSELVFDPWNAYIFGLLPLVLYREATGQPDIAVAGVAWVVKNRAANPSWWGKDIPSVILRRYQFTSFCPNDPNYQRFLGKDSESARMIRIATDVFLGNMKDPTGGATHYYDKSLDQSPPSWATQLQHTVDLGAFHFFKEG